MSESLTNEQLDQLGNDLNYHTSDDPRVTRLISMARRCLSAEERLERAVEALRGQQRNWDMELSRLKFLNEDGGPKEAWFKQCREECQKAVDDLLGTPKELHPPQECAPPAVTDVEPDEECEIPRCACRGPSDGVRKFVRQRNDEDSIEEWEYWKNVPITLCPEHAGDHEPHNK